MVLAVLAWTDVDPRLRGFDPAAARAVAASRLARAGDEAPWVVEWAIDRALIAEYGAWATGWRYSTQSGGVIHRYCCGPHSLQWADGAARAASTERVVSALIEWRAFLEELAAVFAALHLETSDRSIEEGVEHAAARLVPLVVARTDTQDAWYGTLGRVLSWYLESAGHDLASIHATVESVIGGHFASWAEPSAEVVARACTELGSEMARAASRPPVVDSLDKWLRIRNGRWTQQPSTAGAGAREPVTADGHRRYIERFDRARDPVRADRMTTALDACRASAHAGERLTVERLAAWQALVLGEPAPLRTTDAFAKGGRERYAHDDLTHARFRAALAEAEPDAVAPEVVSIRAARLYLDVCYFHPFADGNARAARLALDHVVTRAGLALHAVEPLFLVSRAPADPHGAAGLAWLIDYFAGEPAF